MSSLALENNSEKYIIVEQNIASADTSTTTNDASKSLVVDDYSSSSASSAASPIDDSREEDDDNEIYNQINNSKSRNASLTADGGHILNGCFDNSSSKKIIHRVVLTGGPCAGKTTSINRVKSFFENIGWKVFCVPETATMLLSAGIYFYELEKHTIHFQENLLKTLLQVEDTINQAVKFYNTTHKKNCLVLYDRGAMDPVAYLTPDDWQSLKEKNASWNEIDLRDNRYDQIVHLITAANGAEQFYTLDNNATRTEGLDIARDIDKRCAKAWIGHPYMDVIDNRTNFDKKVARVLKCVCDRIGLDYQEYSLDTRKRKFLVNSMPTDDSLFVNFQDINVVHHYLTSNSPNIQARIRRRGQNDNWSYTYTVRTRKGNQNIETRTQIDRREYQILLKTADPNHLTIYKQRRCFQWNHHYFQLDIYEEPCNPSCRGLIILSAHLSVENDVEKTAASATTTNSMNASITTSYQADDDADDENFNSLSSSTSSSLSSSSSSGGGVGVDLNEESTKQQQQNGENSDVNKSSKYENNNNINRRDKNNFEIIRHMLPEFLDIEREITDDPKYSMFNLSKKAANNNNSKNKRST